LSIIGLGQNLFILAILNQNTNIIINQQLANLIFNIYKVGLLSVISLLLNTRLLKYRIFI
jgi:hypothetical protein